MPSIGISFVDIAIIVGYLLLTLWLGFWVASKSTSLSDLLVGGRSLPWYALLGSIIATETSAVTFLSVPGLTFSDSGNMQFLQLVLGFVFGRVIAAYWLLPSFFAGSRFSAYEVLRNRFGGAAQKTASVLFLLTRTVSDGLRLYLTAIVLAELMQCSMTLALCMMTVVTLIYSASGGIRSIVWNDCLQLIIYLGGAFLALWLIMQGCEGQWNESMTRGWELGKFRWLDLTPSLQSENLWVGLIGGAFLSLATHGTDQMMVQRYLSAKSLKDARLALLLCGPAVLLQFILFLMVGIGLWAFYQVHPPATSLAKDRAFAYFIIHEMPVGIRGLTLAAVLSVAMSTLSSSVGSSASTFVTDLWNSSKGNPHGSTMDTQDDSAELQWLCRVATVVFGLLQLLVALAVAWIPQLQVQSIIEQVLTFSGFASGIVLGVFLLTIRKNKMSPWSLSVGMLVAAAVTSLAVFAPDEALWKVRGTLSAVIASLTTAGVAIVYQTILDLNTSTQPPEKQNPKAKA